MFKGIDVWAVSLLLLLSIILPISLLDVHAQAGSSPQSSWRLQQNYYLKVYFSSAVINGIALSAGNPEIVVQPGVVLEGYFEARVENVQPGGWITPVIGTASWMRGQFSCIADWAPTGTSNQRYTFRITAPNSPGTYYIGIFTGWMYSCDEVASNDHPPNYGDGDDVWDMTNQGWEEVISNGQASTGPYHMPGRAIRIVVQQQQAGEILVNARYVDGVSAPDADVYVDGQYRGRTDVGGRLLVSGLPEGYHTVLVKQSILQGRGIYSSDEIRVYVRAGGRVDVNAVLNPVTPCTIITYSSASPSNPKPGDRVTVTVRYVFLHCCSACCIVKANAFGDWAKTIQLGVIHDGCEGQFHTEIERSFSFTLPTIISPGRHYIRVGLNYAYDFARSYDELAQMDHVDIPIDVQGIITTTTSACEGDLWTDKGGQGRNVDDGTYGLFEPITLYFKSTCPSCNPLLVVIGPYGKFVFSLTGCFEPGQIYQLPPVYFNEERDIGEWTIIMYATPEGADHPIELDRLRIWITGQTITTTKTGECKIEITSITFFDRESDREIKPPIYVGQEFYILAIVRNMGANSICISPTGFFVDWYPKDLLENYMLYCMMPPIELKSGEEMKVFQCGYFRALKPGHVILKIEVRACPGYTPPGKEFCECSSDNYCEDTKEVTLEIISQEVATKTIYTTITTTVTSTIHATATSWSTTYTTASATTYITSTRTWHTTTTYTTTSTITSWITTTVTARTLGSYEKITQLSFIALTILTIPSLIIRAKKLRRLEEVEHQ